MEKEQKFLELAKKYEALQDQMELVREELFSSMRELGVGTYVQDPETMAVHKITKPTGTFTYFRDVDYVRTALEGEARGSLSKKEAQEKGFTLSK